MGAWWSGTACELLDLADDTIIAGLSHRAVGRHRVNEAQQLQAWASQLSILRRLSDKLSDPVSWRVLLEFEIPRLGGRIDAVLLSPHLVIAIELKVGRDRFDADAKLQLHGYALDLQDFHAGCRGRSIVPILVATEALSVPVDMPLLIGGAEPVISTNDAELDSLVALLADRARLVPLARPVDVAGWERATYDPIPNVIDAACKLYRRNSVADIATARADATNLSLTAGRIAAILDKARIQGCKAILFVTGIPGAGKTLCGLNAAFTSQDQSDRAVRATFLTGNPSLVHVLRDALVRDAVVDGGTRATAFHHIKSVIQPLPHFRDLYVRTGGTPPDRVVVIDEAQRCWTAAHAIASTRARPVPLDRSEPAHLLDIMARHDGFSGIVCLIGNGQEIHDGEGGLDTWGDALSSRPEWQVHAAPGRLIDPVSRNRLPGMRCVSSEPALHLSVPVRSLRHEAAPAWVDAVLRGDPEAAREVIASYGEVPFRITRDLPALRAGLRKRARDLHRAGLVASAGARRLRAEGLGVELPHMDASAVACWFLNQWLPDRDVRASDALEVVATQFSVQGLELDQVGLCWDGDLVREGPAGSWQARSFRGTRWQTARDPNKIAWRINTYRVLLTRARYDTLIWVPRGDADDPSRDPAVLDRVAAFLQRCGVRPLEPIAATTMRTMADAALV